MPQPTTNDQVLRRFLDADGRLAIMPTKRSKRLVVLEHICREFEPNVKYPELEVNRVLRRFHDDVPALRRYLVDEQFLYRESNVYWRADGT
jgi:hypothetical protein